MTNDLRYKDIPIKKEIPNNVDMFMKIILYAAFSGGC